MNHSTLESVAAALSCVAVIRTYVTDTVLDAYEGDTEAPTRAKDAVLSAISELVAACPELGQEATFSALTARAESSRLEDYSNVLRYDLWELERTLLARFEEARKDAAFVKLLHPRIVDSSLRHYNDADYREAVLNAMLALTEAIREKSRRDGDGVALASAVFKPEMPILLFSDMTTTAERDDHEGFHKIMLGAFQGIRNPKSHQMHSDLNKITAAQYLVFISLLVRRVDEAKLR